MEQELERVVEHLVNIERTVEAVENAVTGGLSDDAYRDECAKAAMQAALIGRDIVFAAVNSDLAALMASAFDYGDAMVAERKRRYGA
jgi:hypothetical protein